MKRFFWSLLIAPILFGCEGADIEYKYPVKVGAGDQYGYEEPEKFLGKMVSHYSKAGLKRKQFGQRGNWGK